MGAEIHTELVPLLVGLPRRGWGVLRTPDLRLITLISLTGVGKVQLTGWSGVYQVRLTGRGRRYLRDQGVR